MAAFPCCIVCLSPSPQTSDSPVLEFLKVLALCHTVIPETENGEIKLRASSPDEEALVMAAIKLGVKFQERTPTFMFINVVSVSVGDVRRAKVRRGTTCVPINALCLLFGL